MNIERLGGLGKAAPQNRVRSSTEANTKRLGEVLEQLATGKRINRASDDVSGLSLSEQLNSQARGFKMADRNIRDAMSALNVSDGASQQVADIVQRQRELASRARNATVNDEQRKILNKEFLQLSEEINRISETTQFNKQKLANGSDLGSGDRQVQSGANAGDQQALPKVDLRTEKLGTSGIDISSVDGANAAIEAMDVAIEAINAQRSDVGAVSNRFDSASNTVNTAAANTEAAESLIRDQDMAMGLAELTRLQILDRAGMQSFDVFNKISSDHIMGLLR